MTQKLIMLYGARWVVEGADVGYVYVYTNQDNCQVHLYLESQKPTHHSVLTSFRIDLSEN